MGPTDLKAMPRTTKKSSRKKRSNKVIIPFGAKARFVREQPTDDPASVVIARAAEAGIPLSENHVYATRQKMKSEADAAAASGASGDASSQTLTSTPTPSRKVSKVGKNGSRATTPLVNKQKLVEQLETSIFCLGYYEALEVFQRMQRDHFMSA